MSTKHTPDETWNETAAHTACRIQREELVAALRDALSEWDFERSRNGDGNRIVTPEWVENTRAALARVRS